MLKDLKKFNDWKTVAAAELVFVLILLVVAISQGKTINDQEARMQSISVDLVEKDTQIAEMNKRMISVMALLQSAAEEIAGRSVIPAGNAETPAVPAAK